MNNTNQPNIEEKIKQLSNNIFNNVFEKSMKELKKELLECNNSSAQMGALSANIALAMKQYTEELLIALKKEGLLIDG